MHHRSVSVLIDPLIDHDFKIIFLGSIVEPVQGVLKTCVYRQKASDFTTFSLCFQRIIPCLGSRRKSIQNHLPVNGGTPDPIGIIMTADDRLNIQKINSHGGKVKQYFFPLFFDSDKIIFFRTVFTVSISTGIVQHIICLVTRQKLCCGRSFRKGAFYLSVVNYLVELFIVSVQPSVLPIEKLNPVVPQSG